MPEIDPLTEPVEAAPLDAASAGDLEAALDMARNTFGPLAEPYREIIRLAALHPTSRTWDRARSVNITSRFGTLWNAVCKLDPAFPQSIPSPDMGPTIWPRVPDGHLVLRALQLQVQDAA
jgi:hypothetical protein